MGNWKAGQPIGIYSEAKKFFECLGIECSCNVVLYRDSSGYRYKRTCENCPYSCPLNPDEIEYNDDDTSECRVRLSGLS